MNKENTKRWITTLLVMMLTFMGLGQTMVHATEVSGPKTDVIITKVKTNDQAKDMTLEQLEGGVDVASYFTDAEVLPGVSFTWFEVTDAQLSIMKASPSAYDTVAKVEVETGEGSGTATVETGANGQVTIPNLGEGNYWVVENKKGTIESSRAVPFFLILPFTNLTGDGYLDTVHVYPKNTLENVPGEEDIDKKVDESNVAIGDINEWTITLNIPKGIEDYDKFTFYDTIDSRLDFVAEDDLNGVVVDAPGLTRGTDYVVSYTNRKLEVEFKETGRVKLAELDSVKIKYETRVNDSAIMGQDIENLGIIEFDNGHGVTGNPESKDEVHTGGKAFRKRDTSTEALLEGAEFVIMNKDGNYVNVAVDGTVTFGPEANATVFESDVNGLFEVKGLPYGDYTLVETKAPEGYALPTDPNTGFTVNATSYYQDPEAINLGDAAANVFKYINNRALVIPQTGGIGTAIFTIIGAVMMLFSAVFYKKTKKA